MSSSWALRVPSAVRSISSRVSTEVTTLHEAERRRNDLVWACRSGHRSSIAAQ
jgi:hypothetical protein